MKKFGVSVLFLLSFAAQVFSGTGKKQIHLRITDSLTTVYDETNIYLDLGASPTYIYPEDGQKVIDTSSGAPYIYSYSSDGVPCFSNSYGAFVSSVIIPIGFRAGGAGNFSIIPTMLDNFDPTSIVRLEDRTLGTFYDLRQGGFGLIFNNATTDNGRFFLHVSLPAQITLTDAGCNNDNGNINIVQDTSIAWSICGLYDDSLNMLASFNNINGVFAFSTLPQGNYSLLFGYGVYAVTVPTPVEGHQVLADASASTYYAGVGENINFSVTATNTTQYVWNFGDGTVITGVMNADYAFPAPGTYLVTSSCSNSFGCAATDSFTVYVGISSGIASLSKDVVYISAENKHLNIINRSTEKESALELYSIEGQLLLNRLLNASSSTLDLSDLSGGIYFVKVKTAEGDFSQKIFLR